MEANKIEGPFPFLLKTMKSEYVEDTMKYGRFCFNHPSIFNKWENTQAAQYDKWEAHSAFNATHNVLSHQLEKKTDISFMEKV